MMKLITVESLCKDVTQRWKDQYYDGKRWKIIHSGDSEIIYKALVKLGESPKASEIEEIIGNASWTSAFCNECEKHVDALVELGEAPDYASATARICLSCLEKAIKLAKES